jgi:hypothetical protein
MKVVVKTKDFFSFFFCVLWFLWVGCFLFFIWVCCNNGFVVGFVVEKDGRVVLAKRQFLDDLSKGFGVEPLLLRCDRCCIREGCGWFNVGGVCERERVFFDLMRLRVKRLRLSEHEVLMYRMAVLMLVQADRSWRECARRGRSFDASRLCDHVFKVFVSLGLVRPVEFEASGEGVDFLKLVAGRVMERDKQANRRLVSK